MNQLFIAKVEVHISDGYERSETIWKTHPVQAKDENEAKQKVEKHYNDMSEEYGTHYSVNSCEIGELIE